MKIKTNDHRKVTRKKNENDIHQRLCTKILHYFDCRKNLRGSKRNKILVLDQNETHFIACEICEICVKRFYCVMCIL